MIFKNDIVFNDDNYIDLVDKNLSKKDTHINQSINVWGSGNHKKNRKSYNSNTFHIDIFFELFDKSNFVGNFLEIGCGEGIDLRNRVLKINKLSNIYAVDIGQNLLSLSRESDFKNVKFLRCDCTNLPFKNQVFDTIYSWGVFHHTNNFNLALNESIRLLKKDGILFFYTYKKQKNIIKFFGVIIERFLMKLLKNFNLKISRFLCYLISFFVLFLFSYPAQILRKLNISSYEKIPYHWGKIPSDVYLSVVDRLLAPINIRHSKEQMQNLLDGFNLSSYLVIERNEGLFIKIVK